MLVMEYFRLHKFNRLIRHAKVKTVIRERVSRSLRAQAEISISCSDFEVASFTGGYLNLTVYNSCLTAGRGVLICTHSAEADNKNIYCFAIRTKSNLVQEC